MTTTMEEQNATLRAAVAERLANTPADDHRRAGLSSVDEFLTRVNELSQCRATPQENYSEWKPPAYASPVVVGQDVLNEWGEFTREESRQTGDSVLGERPTVAEQTLQSALEAVRDRHTKYGPPVEHFGRTASLVNAAFGTTFTAADWALVMVLDKVARQRGSVGGHDDAAIDIAGYAACHEECRRTLS